MRKFDTSVQYLKYKVLREVARAAFRGDLEKTVMDIPKAIIPGKKPSMRCCVYKERAILGERVKLAMGLNVSADKVIQVIDIACDECPESGYEVTSSCRGCIAHRCQAACPRGAIRIDENHTAHIDKSKCVNCGLCAKVCPYSAIHNYRRPCEMACKLHAISKNEDGNAKIDYEKCTSCGACVYQCPFGAINDKSYILQAIDFLKAREQTPVYAVIAPAISSQFAYAKFGQVISGLKELGFHKVLEAALGADMVAYAESKELVEKGNLVSSCCPAFVKLVRKQFPDMADYISTSLSPMATISKAIKERHPEAKVVFIGPCTAKKAERKQEAVARYVDCVITFEELQAMFDSRDIDITTLEETQLDHASYFGRIFARCGGLSQAVAQGLKEHGADFELRPVSCDGMEACVTELKKASKYVRQGNFLEGMACIGGCVGGAGCLTHSPRNSLAVDKYGQAAAAQEITQSLREEKEI